MTKPTVSKHGMRPGARRAPKSHPRKLRAHAQKRVVSRTTRHAARPRSRPAATYRPVAGPMTIGTSLHMKSPTSPSLSIAVCCARAVYAKSDLSAYSETVSVVPSIFPNIARFASLYQMKQLRSLSVEFLPNSGISHGGQIGLWYDPESTTDPRPQTIAAFLSDFGSQSRISRLANLQLQRVTLPVSVQLGYRDETPSTADSFASPGLTKQMAVGYVTQSYEGAGEATVAVGYLVIRAVLTFKFIRPAEEVTTEIPGVPEPVKLSSEADETLTMPSHFTGDPAVAGSTSR